MIFTANQVINADDTVLLFAAKDVKEIEHHLNSDLDMASTWFHQNTAPKCVQAQVDIFLIPLSYINEKTAL